MTGVQTCALPISALPVVRRALDCLGGAGSREVGLSGLVMTPYSQRGGTAAFLPADREARLVRALRGEPARGGAMVPLALRLGLRDGDIRNLRFDETGWAHGRICPSRQETGVASALPLVPEVGGAIMGHVEGERPRVATGCPYVFVRGQAPHVRLTSPCTVCSKALRRSGAVGEGEGPAGTRLPGRTLARRMLEAAVQIGRAHV